jgi:hypothetical protein
MIEILTRLCAAPASKTNGIYSLAKDFSSVAVAIIVGLLAAYFSLRQFLIAREKLRLDLFDKRLKVFNSLMMKLAAEMGDARLTQEQYSAAQVDIAGAEFLFPPEVCRSFSALLDMTRRYGAAESAWKAKSQKPYSDEIEESAALAETMRGLRDEYDRAIVALPAEVAAIMRFGHIQS